MRQGQPVKASASSTDASRRGNLAQRVAEARARLDKHTREIVAWHFDPKTGCPFWLDYAAKLDWEPRKEIQSYDDLRRFEPFNDD